MTSNQAPWTKPHLNVLLRGTPEENVLTHCKRIGSVSMGSPSNTAQTGCDRGPDNNCGACQSRSGS